jgi:hypothetical protein
MLTTVATIEELFDMADAFEDALEQSPAATITHLSLELTKANMGAAALQRHMPRYYQWTVNKAGRWLRDAELVQTGTGAP